MITVKFAVYGQATLKNGVWTVPNNKQFQQILNKMSTTVERYGSDPFPAMTVAKEMAKQFDGKVLGFDPPNTAKNKLIY